MSMGIIKNGEYDKVAGYSESGELVIGASTIRKGTFTFVKRPDSQFCDATVTFDTPMPDADYEVNISWVTESGISMYGRVQKKTVNGFKFEGYYGSTTDAGMYGNQGVAYTAFKLFTKEGLGDLENDVAALKKKDTTKAITATITNSKAHSDSFIWVNRNGNVVQVAAKFAWNPGAQVVFLETWATGLPKPIHMLWPLAVAFAAQPGNPALPLQLTVDGELKLDNGWTEYLAEHPSDRAADSYATFTYITDDPF